ncbi:Coenzyme F420 hydrogenase/dehydrogenase, beta subunit C-terminal domain [Enterococcus sp.]|uniref:Coenzyme F420 hydrogenase/dehydrogenase, beta subunit C-terminal domain n=1 Tax=Enterococcus sp. TaxID=35783 RepID=UPI002FC97463
MNTIDDLFHKIIDEKYGFGTGVWPVVNSNLEMKFNEVGEYIPVIKNAQKKFSDDEIRNLKETNLFFSTKNVSDIADELFSDVPNIHFNPKIGYYTSLYAGHVSEKEYRLNASSGGFGTWILSELLEKNYVDHVIHVKESNEDGKLFQYTISKNVDEINQGAKTKYYPVELSGVLEYVKKNSGKYAIIGLPSFIMELRLLSQIDQVINNRIKICVGLVCGHQKSKLFGDFLAWQCGVMPDELIGINFRKKLDNEQSNTYAVEVKGIVEGKEITISKKMKDLYGGDWGQGFFKLRASDFTDDVMNETADITLGDAWLPEYTKDSQGNNIVVVRNPIIDKIIKKGIEDNRLKLDIISEEKIIQSQSAHYRHTQDELSYRIDKKDKNKEWRPQVRINNKEKIPLIRKKIQDNREWICLEAPIVFLETVKKNDFNLFVSSMEPVLKKYRYLYRIENLKNKIFKKLKIK